MGGAGGGPDARMETGAAEFKGNTRKKGKDAARGATVRAARRGGTPDWQHRAHLGGLDPGRRPATGRLQRHLSASLLTAALAAVVPEAAVGAPGGATRASRAFQGPRHLGW